MTEALIYFAAKALSSILLIFSGMVIGFLIGDRGKPKRDRKGRFVGKVK